MNIHLILPAALVDRLDQVASEMDMRRTELLRQVLVRFLKSRETKRIEREMAEYVAELAPYSGELVKETGRHTANRLLRETKW